ncbi:hypothetical protein MJM28_31590, partial [Salmonella enterica subsp. enterica serovar Montevideo]|nr:hypothetical protein [Salmonella enterica subsp. enterica serovar Montevideo]
DDNGVAQLWLISPQGGEPRQLTHHATGVQSAFNWHPSGKWLGQVYLNATVNDDKGNKIGTLKTVLRVAAQANNGVDSNVMLYA